MTLEQLPDTSNHDSAVRRSEQRNPHQCLAWLICVGLILGGVVGYARDDSAIVLASLTGLGALAGRSVRARRSGI
jgi:hypothetical protein